MKVKHLVVSNRLELYDAVNHYVDSIIIRRVFNELTANQMQKLINEIQRRIYFTNELGGLIYKMFIQ